MKQNYVNAVLELLRSGHEIEGVLSGLEKVLRDRGHVALYSLILRSVVRVIEGEQGGGVALTVANNADVVKLKAEIDTALQNLKSSTEPSVRVDKTIIGGFIAEANYQRIDASYKNKLVSLYREITR